MDDALRIYNEIFKSTFNVDDGHLQNLEYKEYPEWNSMAHIAMISALEDEFNISFDADDIFAFTSYEEGKKLMKSRFGINL